MIRDKHNGLTAEIAEKHCKVRIQVLLEPVQKSAAYLGCGLALPMSRTTFQLPSFCNFQMLVYLP